MKNVSTYSDIRQYITETLILPDNLFLAILLNGLLYSIIKLFPHTTFCLAGNIILLSINICNPFLLILSDGLLYSIINLFPHTTSCLVGSITLLLINIYIARFILNKNKRLIPDNNNIQELQNQRETDILPYRFYRKKNQNRL